MLRIYNSEIEELMLLFHPILFISYRISDLWAEYLIINIKWSRHLARINHVFDLTFIKRNFFKYLKELFYYKIMIIYINRIINFVV